MKKQNQNIEPGLWLTGYLATQSLSSETVVNRKEYTGIRKFMTSFLVFFICSLSVKAADFTVEQWKMVEISLTSTVTYSDPFNGVNVTATFTHTDGTVIVRPAFWDSSSTWKIRFAPIKTGNWTMTTTCTDVSNTGMHNISKTIQCNAYTGTLEIYKHGFLKVDASGRYFVYNDGTPFFYLGDTHWTFIHERFSTSNVSGVASQFKYTLDKRITQGFTVYQTEAIQEPHGGTHTGSDEEKYCNFRDGFTTADIPGFRNIDRKFQYIADNGLVNSNSSLCWALDPSDYASSYSDTYMYNLSRYWVARYGAYPVLWTIAQEIDNDMYGAYNSTTINKWFSVGQAISDNDGYGHPLSAHMESGLYASGSSWGSKSYHDWWATQGSNDLTDVAFAKSFWNSQPAKPAILYEALYDGFGTDTKGARGAGYKAFQNGMYGYGYGANGIWNDLYTLTDNGSAYLIPEKYLNWYDGANLTAGSQMTYLKQFYTSLQWWKLKPRFNDNNWAAFSDVSKSLLSTDGQKVYVVYFFGDGTGSGTLKNLLNGYTYNAKWFNPSTGAYNNISDFTTTNNQWTIPSRPTADDWVLLVQTNSSSPVLSSNLALNKTYTSSSNFDANQVASKAFDANYSTNWQSSSGTFANQWLSVNFGASTTFNTVVLAEYGDRVSGFRIEYSTDGTSWTTAYTGTTIGGNTFITFPSVSANYARVYFTSGTADQPIIYEFQVYNNAVTTSQGTNIALSKTYSSSTNYDANQVASKAFDANYTTNWQSQSGTFANQWLSVDFAANQSFDKVILSEYGNRTTGFRIEYSTNGSSWTTAYTGTTIGNSKTITFGTVTGRYARIYFTSGTSGTSPIIYEFEVYNTSKNLALNRTYSSSTNWDANQTADKAFDASITTNWQSQNGTFANQWLYVYFTNAITFNTIKLSEYGDRTTGFKIEYSNDGTTWTTAFTGTAIGSSKTINFNAVTAKYARLYFTSGTGTSPVVYEFEVYNTSSNIALNSAYTSSTNWDANQTADKAFDANYASNWQAQNGTFANQWLAVNFGRTVTFDKVVLSEYGNRTSGFRIEYSTDGSTWQTAYTGTAIGSSKTITFPAVTAVYARIYFTSGSSPAPVIYEFEIYNSTSTSSALRQSNITPSAEPEGEIAEGINLLYPNPAKGTVRFQYNSSINETVTISVFNSMGERVKVRNRIFIKGQNIEVIDLSKFTSGQYYLQVKGTKTFMKKFMLIN